jgi:hypothetical protein
MRGFSDYSLCLWIITVICYFRLSFDGLGAGSFEQQILKTSEVNIGTIIDAYA